MILNIKRTELLAQVKTVVKAAAGGHSIKELSGILLETDGRAGVLRMTATNLEVAIRATMPAAIERDGTTVVDARLFLSLLGRLSGDDVYLELKDNGHLYISGGKPQFSIAVLDGKNFPKVEIPYPGETVSVKGVKTLINKSVFAASGRKSGNPVLDCVNLIFTGDGVRAVGCDGTCAVSVKGDTESRGDISILVPASSMKLLASIINDNDVYELGVTGTGDEIKSVVFSDGTTLFSARLMNGKYLDTNTLFKSITPVVTARVDALKLQSALESVSVLTSGTVEFTISDSCLLMRCVGVNGSVSAKCEAEISGDDYERYYYSLANLISCARILQGAVTLSFSRDKMLGIESDSVRFIQLGMRGLSAEEPSKKTAA